MIYRPQNSRRISEVLSILIKIESSFACTQKCEVSDWEVFCASLTRIGRFSGAKSYQIGVVVAGIRMLAHIRKHPSREFTEEGSTDALRKEEIGQFRDRCFRLPDDLPRHCRDRLLDMVITVGCDKVDGNDPILATP